MNYYDNIEEKEKKKKRTIKEFLFIISHHLQSAPIYELKYTFNILCVLI